MEQYVLLMSKLLDNRACNHGFAQFITDLKQNLHGAAQYMHALPSLLLDYKACITKQQTLLEIW